MKDGARRTARPTSRSINDDRRVVDDEALLYELASTPSSNCQMCYLDQTCFRSASS